jgi:hypothetical protein
MHASLRMLLASSVSAEGFVEESVEVPRVNGGTASVVVVEAIDAPSSSPTTCTGRGDLKPPVLRELIK